MSHRHIESVEKFGNYVVELFHLFGLFVIGCGILWASWAEVFKIISEGHPGIKDILLLFIYLELGAMVGIYFRNKQLPVRFLIYIAITALTRVWAINIKTMTDAPMLAITGAILLLSLAVLTHRFASAKYPGTDPADT